MEYTKKPLSVESQIEKLKRRGLLFDDENLAANYLSNISYYRLRAYTYPFQDNKKKDKDHHFLKNDIHFHDIIDLYCFDRRLRLLIFNAIEKIEIAVRTKIVYEYSVATNNSHWFTDKNLYFDTEKYEKTCDDIEADLKNNKKAEDFIKHYYEKYKSPEQPQPPAWMTLEVLTFGKLIKLYSRLDKNHDANKKIVKSFGLSKVEILRNWLFAVTVLRNFCAHHSRIWNRRFLINIIFPSNAENFIDKATVATIRNNKIFAYLSCIKYMLNIISPESNFKENLTEIIDKGGSLLKLKDMGFPENWESFDVWK